MMVNRHSHDIGKTTKAAGELLILSEIPQNRNLSN